MSARIVGLVIAALFGLAPFAAHTQGTLYPTKPVRLIVPSAPGSPPDVVARLLSEKLTISLEQPVVVDNRPGAVGTIGLNLVAKAPPDGYTVGILDFAYIAAPSMIAKMPYDTEKDLTAVDLVARQSHLLVVPSGSSARSVAELIGAAKARPGFLKYSSAGNGTPGHLASELFKREAGVDIVHIPYKGAAPATLALISGEVDMSFLNAGSVSTHIISGKLRALATAAARRVPKYPDIPTLAELGFSNVTLSAWVGVVEPTGTPKEVVSRLHSVLEKIGEMPETKQRLDAMGLESAHEGPEEFAAYIRSELQKWNKVVRDAGIKPD